MITKEQALTLGNGDIVHENGCKKTIGSRGGIALQQRYWRVSGKVKTWARDKHRFEFPVKFGLYANGRITNLNAEGFHLPVDCEVK